MTAASAATAAPDDWTIALTAGHSAWMPPMPRSCSCVIPVKYDATRPGMRDAAASTSAQPDGFRFCGIVDDPPPGSAASLTSACISSAISSAALPRAAEIALLAEAEFRREDELFRNKLVSENEWDIAKASRDGLQKQVGELERLVAEVENNFASMQPAGANQMTHLTEETMRDHYPGAVSKADIEAVLPL